MINVHEHPHHLCPSCGGPRLAEHPAWFVWQHQLDCTLLAAEDATAAADHDNPARWRAFTRPATTAERTLLAACGIVLTPTANTEVEYLTDGVRRRRWDGVDLEEVPSGDD